MKWIVALLPTFIGLLHQFLISLNFSNPFFRNYFDDFLTIPIVLGLTDAFVYSFNQRIPLKNKIILGVLGTIFFSIFFEYIVPNYYTESTSDYWDILAYSTGATFYIFLSYSLETPRPNKA